MKIQSTLEFCQQYPEASSYLPLPYQNDDVLEFWVTDSEIRCQPKENERAVLGTWTSLYNPITHKWNVRFGTRF
jgi:hypothetical protein